MKYPIRILHVVYLLNRGGMESRIMDLYRNLNKERYQMDFYVESGEHGVFENEIKQLGGRIFYPLHRGKKGIPNFRSFRRFLENHSEYKVVYAYNQWSGFYLKQAFECGVPNRIAYARTSLQKKTAKNWIKNIVKLNVKKYATHKFAVSKRAGEWLFGKHCDDYKVWPNAIDAAKYRFSEDIRFNVREELGLKDELTIIHVGNIRPEKNHSFLLDVFSCIKKFSNNAQLVLIGGGEYSKLAEKIHSLSLENSIHYLGVRSDVPRLLSAGDVFIFPSFYEGFPGAVIEAEASGLFCIVSDSVTDEVMLTENIVQLPLSYGPEKWAQCAIKPQYYRRDEKWREIISAGYDIYNLAQHTEVFLDSLMPEVNDNVFDQVR